MDYNRSVQFGGDSGFNPVGDVVRFQNGHVCGDFDMHADGVAGSILVDSKAVDAEDSGYGGGEPSYFFLQRGGSRFAEQGGGG